MAEQNAFNELRATFASGKTRPLEWRLGQLEALKRGIKECVEDATKALHDDLKRPPVDAVNELLSISAEIALTLKSLKKWAAPEEVATPAYAPAGKSVIYSRPKGVALLIGPFNFPIALMFSPLLGAIGAGNCCILKPSEMTPNCARAIQKIVDNYLDKSAFRVIQGGVVETTALLKLPFDHFFYTGNGRVGKLVMQAAAEHLASCTLELGGKSPVYIHEDANLEITAKRITHKKFMNDGQICIAPDYLLVNEKIRDELVAKMKENLTKFYGPNKDGMSRLVNTHHFDRIKKMLDENHKGKVVEGDMSRADRNAKYIPPTFIIDPSTSSTLMTEEIFGPVLPILTVKNVEQAIKLVNAMDNPLAAYAFTEDESVAEKFLGSVPSGGGCVNDVVTQVNNPNLPFGGTGKSGVGSYHGKYSFDCFSNKQSVFLRKTDNDDPKAYPPYNPKLAEMLKSAL